MEGNASGALSGATVTNEKAQQKIDVGKICGRIHPILLNFTPGLLQICTTQAQAQADTTEPTANGAARPCRPYRCCRLVLLVGH